MRRADSLEKTLMLGKIEGRRIRGQQKMIWLDNITYLMDMSFSKLWEIVKDRVLQSRNDWATDQHQLLQIAQTNSLQ